VAGSIWIQGTTTLATNTWYHLALARTGIATKMFLNGVQEGPTFANDSYNYVAPIGTHPFFGIYGLDGTSYGWIGNMDEIRISKGIARWTSNFTPPTVPYS
jgi:hypothetical protein